MPKQKCEHGKLKTRCFKCGGGSICEHRKRKEYCKECGGSSICEHGKQKQICKNCYGKQICQHGKHKQDCRDCGGSSLCVHDKRKYYCNECNGTGFCEHNKRKENCKECGGSSICEHGKHKQICKECGGGSICVHGKVKSVCKECGGLSICEHGKRKYACKPCGGSMFCQHSKNKYYCKDCDGRRLCKSSWCYIIGIKKYQNYCLSCCIQTCPDIPVVNNYKTKEKETVDRIKEKFPDFTWVHDKKIQDGCSKRRPDLLCDFGSHIIIVEVDENKHTDYDTTCEHKRLMEISQDLSHRPIVFIRFNPDNYILEGKNVSSCWSVNGNGVMVIKKSKQKEWVQRINVLNEKIEHFIKNPSEKTIEIVELFY